MLLLQPTAANDMWRKLQAAPETCTTNDAADRIAKTQAACCPNANDCPTGWPTTCDATCAPMFLDLYEKCHDVIIQLAGPPPTAGQGHDAHANGDLLGIQQWDALRDSCIEGLRPATIMCAGWPGVTQVSENRGVLVDGSADLPYGDNFECSLLFTARKYTSNPQPQLHHHGC